MENSGQISRADQQLESRSRQESGTDKARSLPPVQVVVADQKPARDSRVPRGWDRAREIYRFRGPGRFLLLAMREILRPVLYWHAYYIIDNEILPTLPPPKSQRGFETVVYHGDGDVAEATHQLAGMEEELTPAEIATRLRRGDAVAVPQAEGLAMGCLWMTCRSGLPLVFGTRWLVHPDEAVLYDTFVRPQWRGRGLHACMDIALNNWAYPRGIKRAYASISALNNQSLGITRLRGKSRVMTLVLVKLRGIAHVWKRTSGAPYAEFFEDQPSAASSR
jgi:GNAT superfamily N-acetyltransferase